MSNENKSPCDHPVLHDQALDALVAADQALAYAPALALTEPHTLKDVTLDWLNTTLGANVPGAKLEELIGGDGHDGMTSRRNWTLRWNDAGQKAGLPSSLFVKATPDKPSHREMLSVLHMGEGETKFYQMIRPEIPDLAPVAYYCKSYPGGRYLVLMEDLVQKGCRPYWQADDCSIDHARAVVVTLATLHAKYWSSERLLGDLAWVRPRTKRFGWPWLRDMTSGVRKAFLERGEEVGLSADTAALLRTWDKHANAVFGYLDNHKPYTVLHGDSHLGNTFSYPDGRAGYFDWQVIFRGHGLRDVAYFLMTALTNEDRITHEKELFELYLETLAEGGVKLEKEEAWNDYCLFALDRWDAVITAYVHGSYGHGLSGQLRQLRTITGSIVDNDLSGRLEYLIRHKLDRV